MAALRYLIGQVTKLPKYRQEIKSVVNLINKNLSQIQKKRSVISKVNKELKKGIKENSNLES